VRTLWRVSVDTLFVRIARPKPKKRKAKGRTGPPPEYHAPPGGDGASATSVAHLIDGSIGRRRVITRLPMDVWAEALAALRGARGRHVAMVPVRAEVPRGEPEPEAAQMKALGALRRLYRQLSFEFAPPRLATPTSSAPSLGPLPPPPMDPSAGGVRLNPAVAAAAAAATAAAAGLPPPSHAALWEGDDDPAGPSQMGASRSMGELHAARRTALPAVPGAQGPRSGYRTEAGGRGVYRSARTDAGARWHQGGGFVSAEAQGAL